MEGRFSVLFSSAVLVERGYTLDSAVRYCSCSSRCGGSTVAGILDLGLRGEKGGEGDLYSKTLDIGWGCHH
jgi:hypothetical protein